LIESSIPSMKMQLKSTYDQRNTLNCNITTKNQKNQNKSLINY